MFCFHCVKDQNSTMYGHRAITLPKSVCSSVSSNIKSCELGIFENIWITLCDLKTIWCYLNRPDLIISVFQGLQVEHFLTALFTSTDGEFSCQTKCDLFFHFMLKSNVSRIWNIGNLPMNVYNKRTFVNIYSNICSRITIFSAWC